MTLELDEPKPKVQWVTVDQYFRHRPRNQTWRKTVEAVMALLITIASPSLLGRHWLFQISVQFEGRLQKVQVQKRGMETGHGG